MKNPDWHKIALYAIIIGFLLFYGYTWNGNDDTKAEYKKTKQTAASYKRLADAAIQSSNDKERQLADLKQKYKADSLKTAQYKKELADNRESTKVRLNEVRAFNKPEQQQYFVDNQYIKDSVPCESAVASFDSIGAGNVIYDLEIGKAAVKDVEILQNENASINQENDTLKNQVQVTESQKIDLRAAFEAKEHEAETWKQSSEKNYRETQKQKAAKIFWKLSPIPAFIAGFVINNQLKK